LIIFLSSLAVGNDTELAKLKLWKLANTTTTQLKLDVYVDNSIIEVHANDEAFITTRVYPWLEASTGAGLLGANRTSAVMASDIELWDGLVNAFPSRAENTSTGLVW
jgi:beta-fructofuranosidase